MNKKYYLIAEIGVNYYDIAKKENISLMDAAKLMIKKAKEGGANAAKFQSYKADKLASKNSPAYWDISKESTKSQFELFAKLDKFNEEEYLELSKYCRKIDIDFLSTPFDLESVDFLNPLVNCFKVASADITNYPLLEKIAKTNKPLFLSTGASTLEEIEETINFLKKINSSIDITLLHCVLSYPTKNVNANLLRLKYLKNKFPELKLGYSDHTLPDDNLIILPVAATLGATILEKHFTLDKSLKGNDHYHAMDLNDLKNIRKNLDLLDSLFDKDEKNYLECEQISRKQARRSIFLKRDMKKGEIIFNSDLIMKRPGIGISPKDLDKTLGKKLNKDLNEDELLSLGDLC